MSQYRLIKGDATQQMLNQLRTSSYDGCLTDPPYGYTAFKSKSKKTMNWEKEDVPAVELWEGVHRVLKPGALLVAATGSRTYHRIAMSIEQAGFYIMDQFLWLYSGANATGVTEGYRLRPAVEPYVVARKPGRSGKLRGFFATDVRVQGHVPCNVAMAANVSQALDILTGKSSFFFCAKAHGAERLGHDHPTPKPLALTEHLARLMHQKGARNMLVPFSGVGSEMIGALRAGWETVTGVEREDKYVAVARKRIPRFVPDAVEWTP